MGLQIENSMNKSIFLSEKMKMVKECYFQADIVCTAPGMKDFMTVHGGQGKQHLQKHYLTM